MKNQNPFKSVTHQAGSTIMKTQVIHFDKIAVEHQRKKNDLSQFKSDFHLHEINTIFADEAGGVCYYTYASKKNGEAFQISMRDGKVALNYTNMVFKGKSRTKKQFFEYLAHRYGLNVSAIDKHFNDLKLKQVLLEYKTIAIKDPLYDVPRIQYVVVD